MDSNGETYIFICYAKELGTCLATNGGPSDGVRFAFRIIILPAGIAGELKGIKRIEARLKRQSQ